MAPFNKDLPGQAEPNYLGLSKPISQPDADKSKAIAIQGFTQLFDQGVKSADFSVKESIKDRVNSFVEKERDAFIEVQEGLVKNLPVTPGASGAADPADDPDDVAAYEDPMNAMAQANPQDVPELRTMDTRLDALEAARAKGLPFTEFWGRMRQFAKELRTANPGYVDYIDARIASKLGTDPANAYMRAQQRQIDAALRAAGKGDDITKKINQGFSSAVQEGVEGSAKAWETFQKTGDKNAATEWIERNKAYKHQDNVRRAEEFKETKDREAGARSAGDYIDTDSQQTISNFFYATAYTMGAGRNMSDIQDTIKRAAANPNLINDDVADRMALEVVSAREEARKSLRRKYMKEETDRMGNKTSIMQKLGGPEQLEKRIDQNLKIFDSLLDRIKNKEWGLATANQRGVIDLGNAVKDKLLRDQTVGTQILLDKAINELGSPYAKGLQEYFASRRVGEQDWTYFQNLMKGIATGNNPNTVEKESKVSTPPPVPGQPAPKKVYTLNEAFQDTKDRDAPPSSPIFYQTMKATAEKIADPSIPADKKINFFSAVYDPKNTGFIEKQFANNSKKDKYEVYRMFTSPTMAQEAFKLQGQVPESNAATNMANWTKNEFITLFRGEAKELSDLRLDRRIQIRWDDKNYRFESQLTNIPVGQYTQYAGDVNQLKYQTDQVLGRLNTGIRGIANINEAAGSDNKATNAFVYEMMVNAGFDPKKTSKMNPSPTGEMHPIQAMGEAILSTSKAAQPKEGGSGNAPRKPTEGRTRVIPEEPRGGIAHFTEETKSMSPKEWQRSLESQQRTLEAPAFDATSRRMPLGQNMTDQEGEILGIESVPNPQGLSPRQMMEQRK
jgi:hypothetical protein